MKILLFGGSGQLGYELKQRAADLNFEIVSPVTSEVNISEREQVIFLTRQLKPSVVINSAAYTAVDNAESDEVNAHQINALGAGYAAEAAREVGARFLHISTDYVFNGEYNEPISEIVPTDPVNIYGKTKLEGELKIQEIYPEKSLVIRTSSLYGQKGVNFVRTMLGLFESKPEIKVVSDQFMSPTWAGWLAEVVLDLSRIEANGVVHATCSGETSWYGFAKEIFNLSKNKVKSDPAFRILETTASEFARPAKRPRYSVLDCHKLANLIDRSPLDWREALKFHLQEIGKLG